MLFKLFLAFTLIPALELYLLIQIGQYFGPVQTVLLIMVTGALGASLAKREGLSVLRTIADEAAQGFPSGDRLVEGFLVVVGGILLITPGVLTDLAGLSLIFPPIRRRLAPYVKRQLMERFAGNITLNIGGLPPSGGPQGPRVAEPESKPKPFDHPVA